MGRTFVHGHKSSSIILFREHYDAISDKCARVGVKHAKCVGTNECKIELVGMVSAAYSQRGYWNNCKGVLETRQEVSLHTTKLLKRNICR